MPYKSGSKSIFHIQAKLFKNVSELPALKLYGQMKSGLRLETVFKDSMGHIVSSINKSMQ